MRHLKKIIFGGIIVFIVIVCLANICVLKNPDFWKITIGNCLTLIIALVISYYFTKKNQDANNKKAILLELLHKLDDLINDEELVVISEKTDINRILMKKRQISNYLGILKNNEKQFCIEKEVTFLDEKLNEYFVFLGEHQDDLDYLKKSHNDLRRPLDLIRPKLVETMIKLYD